MTRPETPGIGVSPAGYTSVSTNVSASENASGELITDRRGAGIAVRLENDHDAAPRTLTSRGDRRSDLGRQVRVVVDERHPVAFASVLEPARDTAEARQRLHRGLHLDPDLERDRDRARGIGRRLHSGRNRNPGARPPSTTSEKRHVIASSTTSSTMR